MAEQDWLSPAPAGTYFPPAEAVAPAPAYDLRPLTLGELLDRTFSLYRSRFWLFCGIAAIASALELVIGGIGRVAVHRFTHQPTTLYSAILGITYVAGFIYFFAHCIAQAATTSAMSDVYLGKPASIGSAFRAISGKWYAWIGIGWWQIWSASWIFMALFIPFVVLAALKINMGVGGVAGNVGLVLLGILFVIAAMAYGVIAYIRNSLAIPAKVSEGMSVRKAMRRSKDLAAGAKGRIFTVWLIVYAMNMVAGVLQMPLSFLAIRGGTHIVTEMSILLITFLAHAVVPPVASIGLCLVYFDQRVRREAFDLEFLLGPEQQAAPSPSYFAPVQPQTFQPSPAEPQADVPQL
jgi:hypothetical protein